MQGALGAFVVAIEGAGDEWDVGVAAVGVGELNGGQEGLTRFVALVRVLAVMPL